MFDWFFLQRAWLKKTNPKIKLVNFVDERLQWLSNIQRTTTQTKKRDPESNSDNQLLETTISSGRHMQSNNTKQPFKQQRIMNLHFMNHSQSKDSKRIRRTKQASKIQTRRINHNYIPLINFGRKTHYLVFP